MDIAPPLNILIVGGRGIVGSTLAARLRAAGHTVRMTGRHAAPNVEALDLLHLPAASVLHQQLKEVDVVVHATGIGPSRRATEHQALHYAGPCQLFEACVNAGVRRIVQVSAQGDPSTGSFIAAKHAADGHLLKLPIEACVVRPSLLFLPHAENARLLLTLARLPWLSLPDGGSARVQPMHVADLAELLQEVIEAPCRPNSIIEVGGPRELSMAEYIQTLRRSLNKRPALEIPLPAFMAHLGFGLLGWLGSSVGGAQTLRVLRAGSVGKLARGRDASAFITATEAAALNKLNPLALLKLNHPLVIEPAPAWPLTLFYDGACPLCDREMQALKARDAHDRLHLIDIAAANFNPATHGYSSTELDNAIRGEYADGRKLTGLDTVHAAYCAVGLAHVFRITRKAWLRPIFDAIYNCFARHRNRVSPWAMPLLSLMIPAPVAQQEACNHGACSPIKHHHQ